MILNYHNVSEFSEMEVYRCFLNDAQILPKILIQLVRTEGPVFKTPLYNPNDQPWLRMRDLNLLN